MFKILPKNGLSTKPLWSGEMLGLAILDVTSQYILNGLSHASDELGSLASV
jgi:hypothetical protein